MSDNEEELQTKQGDLVRLYFKASLFILLSGFVFTLGQTIQLSSFVYLNTFTYIDFIINSILIVPFIFLILILVGFVKDWVIEPVSAAHKIYVASRIKGKGNKKAFLSLSHAIIRFLQMIVIPVTILSIFLLSNIAQIIILCLLSLFIMIIFRIFLNKTKEYSVIEEPDFLKKAKKLPGEFIENFTDMEGLVYLFFLIFIFGCMHIGLQQEEKTDATLIMTEKNEERDVNILTSNSNYVVAYRNKKIEIIPRSEIRIIRHESPSFKSIKVQ